jgi:hypothetical protein
MQCFNLDTFSVSMHGYVESDMVREKGDRVAFFYFNRDRAGLFFDVNHSDSFW